MTIFTLTKTDTYKTLHANKIKSTGFKKYVTKRQIGSLEVQQTAHVTGKGVRLQSGGKGFMLQRPAPFKYKLHVNHLRRMLNT